MFGSMYTLKQQKYNTFMIVWYGHVGELRYPSYPEKDGTWKFPEIEAFHCYDKVSPFSLLSCENVARGCVANIDHYVTNLHYMLCSLKSQLRTTRSKNGETHALQLLVSKQLSLRHNFFKTHGLLQPKHQKFRVCIWYVLYTIVIEYNSCAFKCIPCPNFNYMHDEFVLNSHA